MFEVERCSRHRDIPNRRMFEIKGCSRCATIELKIRLKTLFQQKGYTYTFQYPTIDTKKNQTRYKPRKQW